MSNCSLSSLKSSDLRRWDHCHLLILASEDAKIDLVLKILTSHSLNFTYHLVSDYNSYQTYLREHCYDLILLAQKSPILLQKSLNFLQNYSPQIPVIIITDSKLNCLELTKDYLDSMKLNCINQEKIAKLPILIDRSRRYSQQQKYQEIIEKTIRKMSEGISFSDLAQPTINLVQEALGVSRCFLLMPDHNDSLIVRYSGEYTPNSANFLGLKCPIYYYYRSLISKDQPLAFSKIDQHSPPVLQEFAQKNQIHSFLIMPIFYQQNFWGVFCLQHCQNQHHWTETETNFIKTLANQIGIAIYQEQLQQQLQQQKALNLENLQTYQQLEKQYQKRTQELELEQQKSEQANQAKTDFLSHMTHELRTPMTGILGFSKMLMEQIYGSLNEKQMQYIKGIFDSGQHLLELINDLLDISKIEAEREELFFENIPVEDICLASVSMVQEKARQGNLNLTLDIDPEINLCFADQRRLKQILVNLLSNGIKFTEEGYVTLQVSKNKEMICFAVIDTGIGISESDQAKLFQPFSQIRNRLSSKHKGTGLGLVLSLKLAKLHGGDLTFTSEVGKGSCFILKIPQI
jgi:signal transduction histidine kinase